MGLALWLVAASCGGWPFQRQDPDRVVERGRQAYLQNCAVCHGPNAQGAPNWQQPDDRGNRPPPPHDDTGHTWRHPEGQLREIILDGWRDPFNKTPDLTMPAFRGKLSDGEIDAVIAYFKSLWSEEHQRYQREETEKGRASHGAGLRTWRRPEGMEFGRDTGTFTVEGGGRWLSTRIQRYWLARSG